MNAHMNFRLHRSHFVRLPFAVAAAIMALLAGPANAQAFSESQAFYSTSSQAVPALTSYSFDPSGGPTDGLTVLSGFGGASSGGNGGGTTPSGIRPLKHFSRLALGAGFSPLGIGAVVATNINSHLDIRATGNYFTYSTNFNTNGFNVDAKMNLASAGAALDIYPFHKGFRLSPGILVYNQNRATANAPVTPGSSFTINNQTFYAAIPNPALGITALSGTGTLGLHQTKPAFTMTTGWGSLIPRSGRHWAIPFEIGAAFTGTPAINVKLDGWACYDKAQTLCTNVADPSNPIAVLIQNDLNTQVSKWRKDIEPLKVYPIISTGIVINFNIR